MKFTDHILPRMRLPCSVDQSLVGSTNAPIQDGVVLKLRAKQPDDEVMGVGGVASSLVGQNLLWEIFEFSQIIWE